jgi:hypothetical protein
VAQKDRATIAEGIPIFLATLAIRQQSQTIQFRSAAEMLLCCG